MITFLTGYLLLGGCFASVALFLGKRYESLYWLVGGYFPLTLIFSVLFWPIFIPAVISIASIEYVIKVIRK